MKKAPNTPDTSPCEKCHRPCNYTQCRDYRLWLNRCWNGYRRWPEQWRKPPARKPTEVWRYDSPALLHDFIKNGPCVGCKFRRYCSDEESCSAYDTWVQLRWKLLRKRLGV